MLLKIFLVKYLYSNMANKVLHHGFIVDEDVTCKEKKEEIGKVNLISGLGSKNEKVDIKNQFILQLEILLI